MKAKAIPRDDVDPWLRRRLAVAQAGDVSAALVGKPAVAIGEFQGFGRKRQGGQSDCRLWRDQQQGWHGRCDFWQAGELFGPSAIAGMQHDPRGGKQGVQNNRGQPGAVQKMDRWPGRGAGQAGRLIDDQQQSALQILRIARVLFVDQNKVGHNPFGPQIIHQTQ